MQTEALEREVADLYREHAAGLFRYASILAGNGESARDALQDAFLRYFVTRRSGRQIRHPKAWLFRVLRNVLLDQQKMRHTRRQIAMEHARESPDQRPDPERECRDGELSQQVWERLAPRERECLKLRGEGLRYGEIGDVLGIRSGTVGALLARAQRKIRRALRETARQQPGRAARLCIFTEESPYAP